MRAELDLCVGTVARRAGAKLELEVPLGDPPESALGSARQRISSMQCARHGRRVHIWMLEQDPQAVLGFL